MIGISRSPRKRPHPLVVNYAQVETIIYEELQRTWLLNADVDAVLESAARRIDDAMSR
ncbi:hypothetical protein SAMN05920897_108147 [Alkalispirochaeta americana]|uniref:Uncharacterized protein n=1 Tax=Alkalispirochaeta americana TaxID=159291 RepID=A0A1N6SNA5_9SPIO|nr:hypothetical protein SAMN05920897_108147 [Alkalispirochaeta americana]